MQKMKHAGIGFYSLKKELLVSVNTEIQMLQAISNDTWLLTIGRQNV
jgi:hypothetical protein